MFQEAYAACGMPTLLNNHGMQEYVGRTRESFHLGFVLQGVVQGLLLCLPCAYTNLKLQPLILNPTPLRSLNRSTA